MLVMLCRSLILGRDRKYYAGWVFALNDEVRLSVTRSAVKGDMK
jgi:hypothetical protein